MEGRTIKTKKSDQTDSPITVITDWRHTEEMSPVFRKLMVSLLRPREEQREMGNGERDAKANQ